MLLLACHHQVSNSALLDPKSRRHALLENGQNPIGKISGWFSTVDGRFVAVYLCRGELIVQIDQACVQVDELTCARIDNTAEPRGKRLTISRNDVEMVVGFKTLDDSMVADFLCMEEPEDFCFPLWIFNVIQSPERQELMRQNWVDGE